MKQAVNIRYASQQFGQGGHLKAVWPVEGKCYDRRGRMGGGTDLERLKYIGQLGIVFPDSLEHVRTQ
jgi:hypothetical protein